MSQVDFKLYLITDRKLSGERGLIDTVEAALGAAAEFGPRPPIAVQLREKDLDGRALMQLAVELGQTCRRYHVPMLVNGRIDVALAARADGVHLPSDGISVEDARKLLGPSKLIGVSTHTAAEITGAEGNRPTLNPLFQGAGPNLHWLGVRPRFARDLAQAGFEALR